MKSDGIKISDKSIYKILKEKTNNQSVTSFDETFNESFGEENILPTLTRGEVIIEEEKTLTVNEDNINLQNLQELINKGVKEGTEQYYYYYY